MNIKEAKQQIKNAMRAYFTKNEDGEYIVPVPRQRPVFLMGPPGIGKTAIMEQIAAEMGVGLLSYSMTHHTRQSALGLPYIEHRNYEGLDCDISLYTMSEIIASVYDMMKETGVKQGILFLDEINCVSETLAPVMLQFLQYKVFGRHSVPEGWIVVTAGNPPEYNSSVREFDLVTWDRLKRIDVEPDFSVWKEYAVGKNVHPAVLSYLEIKTGDFYNVETDVDGKRFVTARAWEDLALMISLYEKNGIKVDGSLISQYLQDPRIAKDFAVYYDLYEKYKSDYQIESILSGKASDEIKSRAENAGFDERISLISMLLDLISSELCAVVEGDLLLKDMTASLTELKTLFSRPGKTPSEKLSEYIEKKEKELFSGKRSGALSPEAQTRLKKLIKRLGALKTDIASENNGKTALLSLKKLFDEMMKSGKGASERAAVRLSNMFVFAEAVFSESRELLIIVTELSLNKGCAAFIGKYGCKEYFKHNKELLVFDRAKQIENEIAALEFELD
ncbi:MAG: AAA family ATPase [Oscillospiraceae bacterium]|nr:AAA family ATPase [Oscillospiraceae bacterium]